MNYDEKLKKIEENLASGKITEDVYKKEVDRINYRKEHEIVKSNKKKYVIISSILVLIGILVLLYINRYYFFDREYVYIDSLSSLNEPIQEKASGTKRIKIDDEYINITRLYSYKIQARVINTRQYMGYNLMNKLSPVDFGLAWGNMVLDNNRDKVTFYSLGDRLINYRINDNNWVSNVGGREFVNQHISSNHIIPANETIKGKLLSVRKGEYVELEGYLVTAYTTDSDSYIYWSSSDSRTDIGDNAREVIYVTGVKWLKQK